MFMQISTKTTFLATNFQYESSYVDDTFVFVQLMDHSGEEKKKRKKKRNRQKEKEQTKKKIGHTLLDTILW